MPCASRLILTFLALAASLPLVAPSLAAPTSAAQDTRPNILLVFSDDQRADSIGAYGNPAARTPHLDALAARGTTFQRAYCLGGPHGAICIPSRAMLHTGRAYFRLDLEEFEGAPTLGERLGAAGYRTFATGKWHNGRGAFARSFQRAENVMFSGMSDHHLVPVCDLDEGHFSESRQATTHSSELFARSALGFLDEPGEGAPFFCYLAFSAPHDPRDPPQPWAHRYYADLPPLPANFAPQHPWDIGAMTVRDELLAPWPRTEAIVRQQLAEYYALIEHMDHQLGQVLAAVAARADGRETLVVFASDHGLALGSHGLLGKQSVYEHSLRAPLILVGPGVAAGRRSNALVYLSDVYPTLLAAARVEEPDPTSFGQSLWPVLRSERATMRDSLFLAFARSQRAVTDGRYKLIRYPEIDRLRLFDLASDPHELFDLAPDPVHAERIAQLTARLVAWQRDLGDDAPLTVATPRQAEIDLTGRTREPDRWQPAWIRRKYFGQ